MATMLGSIHVNAEFDDEAGVWVATSDEVPGLVAEHANLATLATMVAELVPILLHENEMVPDVDLEQFAIRIHAHGEVTRSVPVLA
jgi:hypothetical protein